MKTTCFNIIFISLVLLLGCDGSSQSNDQSINFTPMELMGLWEVRTTADIQDGVISNTNVLERNTEWVYILDIDSGSLTFRTYQITEALNCLEMQNVELTLDHASHYIRNSDGSFFANITVVPFTQVMAITKESKLVMARERIDLTVDMLVVCE